jgi:copper chaperone CopZ
MAAQVVLKVVGMSCGGCAINLEKALKNVSGVNRAVVDLKGGQALIEYNPEKVTDNDLVKAVKSVGFGVK